MKFNLDTGTGEWFQFFGSEIKPDGEVKYYEPEKAAQRVCLRIADMETLEIIQSETKKKAVEHVYNPKTRQMERLSYFEQTPEQEKKEREMIWDYAIISWEGMLDIKGQEIPCTLENKMKLMNNPQFARFVNRCLGLISGAATEVKKAAEKNS
jgi:hypothetical protein